MAKITNKVISAFFVLLSQLLTPTYASTFGVTTWRPILALGGGASISSDVGQSKNFPIQNPVTDEFYNYSANSTTQAAGLFDVFFGGEWNVQPSWLMQAGVDFNQASNFTAKGTLTQGADLRSADSYTYRYKVLTRQLLLEGKLLYTLKNCYHPYILAGIGAAFNRANNYSTSVPPFLTFTREYSSKATTSFSYALGLGIDADITNYLRLGLGYRFVDLGQAKLGSATIDTTSVPGTLSQSHIYSNEVLAQLTWFFTEKNQGIIS